MGLTSLQVCMDSSDWLQGTIHEESSGIILDSSSPSGDMLSCSRPLMERRLRPPHDQALKCPRCDSTHTKFCYYNNYSLSQPRYFCKTCRRYWTKGGTLRNIPVGGGCRKNKKVSSSSSSNSKKSNDHHHPMNNHQTPGSSSSSHHTPTDLQLSFPADQVQLSHLTHLLGHQIGLGNGNPSFMERNYNAVFENPRPIDFMEREYESLVGSSRNHEFMGNCELGVMGGGIGSEMSHGLAPSFHFQSLYSPFGMALDGNNGGDGGAGPFVDSTFQRLMLPYDQVNDQDQDQMNTVDVKPNPKILSLEWKDQGCSDAGKDSFGSSSLNGLGSWTGFMNSYGTSSTTNPLV